MIFFCHLCKRLGAKAEGSVCTLLLHTCSSPSGGAFGALLCRKNSCWTVALTHPNHWATLRPEPCAATVLLSATFNGNSCGCCRAGFGSGEQRLLQTPDLVVLLISIFSFFFFLMLLLLMFVCLLVFILWKISIQTSFDLLGQDQIDLLKLRNKSSLFS